MSPRVSEGCVQRQSYWMCKQETDFKRGMSHYGKSNMALETHSAIDGEVV